MFDFFGSSTQQAGKAFLLVALSNHQNRGTNSRKQHTHHLICEIRGVSAQRKHMAPDSPSQRSRGKMSLGGWLLGFRGANKEVVFCS